jgi:hypothetical protein
VDLIKILNPQHGVTVVDSRSPYFFFTLEMEQPRFEATVSSVCDSPSAWSCFELDRLSAPVLSDWDQKAGIDLLIENCFETAEGLVVLKAVVVVVEIEVGPVGQRLAWTSLWLDVLLLDSKNHLNFP